MNIADLPPDSPVLHEEIGIPIAPPIVGERDTLLDNSIRFTVGCISRPKMDEDAIRSVHIRRPRTLAFNRNDAFALFTERFGDELLEPRAEARQARSCDQRGLVTSCERQLAKHHTELEPGVVVASGGAALRHVARTIEQRCRACA